jgi:hypothetical protein
MDVDTIELGLDFADAINESLSKCEVLIVVIGKDWLTARDADGEPRLSKPHDYVRLEIEAALAREIRLIPVLVEGAAVPKRSQLPGEMASLARRNCISMSHASFRSDADRLIETLARIMKVEQD